MHGQRQTLAATKRGGCWAAWTRWFRRQAARKKVGLQVVMLDAVKVMVSGTKAMQQELDTGTEMKAGMQCLGAVYEWQG